jgi:predicted MFS family arabinose efflux permease
MSSYASRNAFKLEKVFTQKSTNLNFIYILTALIIALIGIMINSGSTYLIIILFILFYLLRSIRKPIMLDYIANIIEERERATMLSFESQFRTIFVIIAAPILGFISDQLGLKVMFIFASLTMLLLRTLIKLSSLKGID